MCIQVDDDHEPARPATHCATILECTGTVRKGTRDITMVCVLVPGGLRIDGCNGQDSRTDTTESPRRRIAAGPPRLGGDDRLICGQGRGEIGVPCPIRAVMRRSVLNSAISAVRKVVVVPISGPVRNSTSQSSSENTNQLSM